MACKYAQALTYSWRLRCWLDRLVLGILGHLLLLDLSILTFKTTHELSPHYISKRVTLSSIL